MRIQNSSISHLASPSVTDTNLGKTRLKVMPAAAQGVEN
jgi:hypothetical protein